AGRSRLQRSLRKTKASPWLGELAERRNTRCRCLSAGAQFLPTRRKAGSGWEQSMHIGSGIFAALALAALGLAGCGDGGVSSAKASDGAQSDVTVVATGCAKAPKPDCVTLTADGKTWDVTAAGVDLKRGVAVN